MIRSTDQPRRTLATLGRTGVVALAITTSVIAACASREHAVDAGAAPAALRVGIAPNYPPLAFKQNGKITGAEVRFARRLGPALGRQVTVVETAWDDLIPALRDRRIDVIMSGMSITDERKQLVSFVHPYLRVGQMMVLRRGDTRRLRDAAAIDQPSTRVGFVTGTTGDAYVRQHLPRARHVGFESVDSAVGALRAGSIDVFVHDSPSIWRITAPENDPQQQLLGRYEPLTEEYLAWAVRQDDTQLQRQLNSVLSQWNADGTLHNVLGKWIHLKNAEQRQSDQSSGAQHENANY